MKAVLHTRARYGVSKQDNVLYFLRLRFSNSFPRDEVYFCINCRVKYLTTRSVNPYFYLIFFFCLSYFVKIYIVNLIDVLNLS